MNKCFILAIIVILFTSKLSAQFSFEKFIAEKVSKPDPTTELNMEEMLKKAKDAKIDKIAVKVVDARLKDGRIVFKSIANVNLVDSEAKKLNDVLKTKLIKILGMPLKENMVDGVKNIAWGKPEGITYMLTYSGNMTMLVIMNK